MGAGKSTVGRALAERLGWGFEDLDQRVERRERRSVAEIFRDSGEAEFRFAEQRALQQLLTEVIEGTDQVRNRIIALGGGAFAHEATARTAIKSGAMT